MNYKETLDYIYKHLPMFHRIGKAAFHNNLDHALYLDSVCNHPHQSYKTIHVAGTNGKGSVSHMLASVLQSAGYKTGLFTSPHLKDFRERIRVNGEMIPREAIIHFIEKYKKELEFIHPSFFELTSAMAFDYFKEANVEIAVIEVGMGGRLDSTNIIVPELSVITNISRDHTEFLGNTLQDIATEKAGIIKENVPVVIGKSQPETELVFRKAASAKNASLIFADEHYQIISQEYRDMKFQKLEILNVETEEKFHVETDLLGNYQNENILTVLSTLEELRKKGFHVKEVDINIGLKHTVSNTGLMGRWQVLNLKPLTICDNGHNEDGMRWVVAQIRELSYDKLHFVLGFVKDKDVSHILKLLPSDAVYYYTRTNIPRALDENQLMEIGKKAGLNGNSFPTVSLALAEAKKNAKPNDLIFIGGSTFVVAEALPEAEKK